MKETYELAFDDILYDTGYGEWSSHIVADIKPIYENEDFDAHNTAGNLVTFRNRQLSGFEIESATVFVYDNDGGCFLEQELDEGEVLRYVKASEVFKQLSEAIVG